MAVLHQSSGMTNINGYIVVRKSYCDVNAHNIVWGTQTPTREMLCLVCGKFLDYHDSDTSVLVNHLQSQHPHLNIACLPATNKYSHTLLRTSNCRSKPELDIPYTSNPNITISETMYYSHHDLPQVPVEEKKVNRQDYISAEPHQTHSLPQLRTAQKHPMNKNPDPWRPGDQRVFCYFCGFETQPTLRRQKRCTYRPSLLSLVVQNCWPLCFTPCLTTTSQVIDLYCSRCDNYLGSYDRTLGYLTKEYALNNIGIRSCHKISAI